MKKLLLGLFGVGLLTSMDLFSKEVDINAISEDDIYKISKFITHSGLDDFSNKKFSSISYEFDNKGNQYFLVEFEDGGYILLNNDTNKNPIYSFDSKSTYRGINDAEIKKAKVKLDWLDIIAEEIPLDTIRRTLYRKSRSGGSREFIVKIVWKSGSQKTDFDLFIKNANGDICNWNNKDKSEWGAKHLRDDWGMPYKTSYEAFQVDLNKMDRYATDNNLFSKDKGVYKFYVARYSGPNVNYTFSYGIPGSACSSSDYKNCPNGQWVQSVSKTGVDNARYGALYIPTPKAPIFNNVKLSGEDRNSLVQVDLGKKVCFSGSVTSLVGIKRITLELTGPIGADLEAFSDKISNLKDLNLSRYCFDTNNGRFAKTPGSYYLSLRIEDADDKTAEANWYVNVDTKRQREIADKAKREVGKDSPLTKYAYEPISYNDKTIKNAINAYIKSNGNEQNVKSRLSVYSDTEQNKLYNRIKAKFKSGKLDNWYGSNIESNIKAQKDLGFRMQCKEWADFITEDKRTYESRENIKLTKYNATIGIPVLLKKNGKFFVHAAVITDLNRDNTTNEVTSITIAESNWGTGWTHPTGSIPWERRITSRTIYSNEFSRWYIKHPVKTSDN